jgi:hypothetical protein
MTRFSKILIEQDAILAKAEEAKKILQRITGLLEEKFERKIQGKQSNFTLPCYFRTDSNL